MIGSQPAAEEMAIEDVFGDDCGFGDDDGFGDGGFGEDDDSFDAEYSQPFILLTVVLT